jgi:predicted ribosome quality control (RQC) complex YloA/Tae2 family protein
MKEIVEKFRQEIYETLPKVVYRELIDGSIEELYICNSDFLQIDEGRIYFWYEDNDDDYKSIEIYYVIDKGMTIDEMLDEYDLYSSKDEVQEAIRVRNVNKLERLKNQRESIEKEIQRLNSNN